MPSVEDSTTVTVFLNFILPEEGDISAMVGTLTVQLFWSRDKVSYVGESMALVSGNDVYRGTILRQDGKGNYLYDDGIGVCYWYIKISNNAQEESFLFTSTNPNDEIYFFGVSGETITPIETVTESESPIFAPLANVIEKVFAPLGSVAEDPLFQVIILIFAGITLSLIIFGSRLGPYIGKVLSPMFRRR